MPDDVKLRFDDTFAGDDDNLLRSAAALLFLDASGSLVPHGVGGLARTIIGALAARLAARPDPSEEDVERVRDAILDAMDITDGLDAEAAEAYARAAINALKGERE